MLVELKNGETLNGHLVNCDTWMNLTLKEVVQTSPVCARNFSHPLYHGDRSNRLDRILLYQPPHNPASPSGSQYKHSDADQI